MCNIIICFFSLFFVFGMVDAQELQFVSPNVAKDVSIFNNRLQLPIGTSEIFQKGAAISEISSKIDNNYISVYGFCQQFECDEKNNIVYSPLLFKEYYDDNSSISEYFPKELMRSSRKLTYIDYDIYFSLFDYRDSVNSAIFILSVKDKEIIDTLKIYYEEGHDAVSYSRRFYIDRNFIISARDYITADSNYVIDAENKWRQESFNQYMLNSEGKFVHYYVDNGHYQDNETQGLVDNHTRDRLWVEVKQNRYTGSITYLEAQYQQGIPVGEWRYYSVKQSEGKAAENGLLLNYPKDELLYTETYENGKITEFNIIAPWVRNAMDQRYINIKPYECWQSSNERYFIK